MVNHSAQSPFELVAAGLLAGQIDEFLARLSEDERRVLSLRYGLDRGEPRTQGEVGELLDLTAERVRRIERDALAKLRRAAGRQRRPRPARQLNLPAAPAACSPAELGTCGRCSLSLAATRRR